MKFGDKVLVTGILQRKSVVKPNPDYKPNGYFPADKVYQWKIWSPNAIPQREGILIGFRTLSDGIRDWIGEEEGWSFIPVEHFKAALVVFNERQNPVYCLLGDIR